MREVLDVREPTSVAEHRTGLEVIGEAWRAAFVDVVSSDAIANVEELSEADDLSERFAEQADRDDVLAVVAVLDNRIVGSTAVIWDPEGTKPFVAEGAAEIRSLYVHPNHWGRGIGTRLLDAIERRVPDALDSLALETLRDVEATRSFYESRGFELAGETTFEIAEEGYPTVIYRRPRES